MSGAIASLFFVFCPTDEPVSVTVVVVLATTEDTGVDKRLAELAKEVGLSRSTLVERFTRYLSEPPMAYLIRWRLQLAARALASTSRGVAEIAADVGYESESAFNRAFKREFDSPPARYRREHRTADESTPG
jgi:AraC-like DNA-binding protein